MSKVKSDKIPHYELLYLISNKYSETELEPVKAKVTKLIENHGGEITYSEDLGKRRLAYAIKGFRYGYYELVEFDLAGAELIKLENDMKLDHEILRHQIVKKVKKSLEEIKAEAEAIAVRLAKDEEAEPVKPVEAPVKETEVTAKEVETSIKKAEPKEISISTDKELDKELDNIISSDMLK